MIYLVCSVLMVICNFLPIMVLKTVLNGEADATYAAMMPTLSGYVGLIAAGACVAVPFLGLKNKTALVATVASITSGIFLARRISGLKSLASAGIGLTNIMNSLSSSNAASMTVDYSFGFYLYILAIILVVVSGFVYTMSED